MDIVLKKTKNKKLTKISFDEEVPINITHTIKKSEPIQNQSIISDTISSVTFKEAKEKRPKRKKNKDRKKEELCAVDDTLEIAVEGTIQSELQNQAPNNIVTSELLKEPKENHLKRKKKKHQEQDKIDMAEDPLKIQVEGITQVELQNQALINDVITSDPVKEPKEKHKKRKKDKYRQKEETKTIDDTLKIEVEDTTQPKLQKKESKRGKKRKKHEELLLDKKTKTDCNTQERSLNYLSKWKHSPNDWKFEKNRQVWLKQNMFNCERIPEEFWDILTEYFSKSKGNIRKNILDEAVKIVDGNEEQDDILFNRARSIIQCLQE